MERVPIAHPRNLEEWCLSQLGERLYEIFIQGHTKKQWQRDPKELPASLIRRLPVRLSFNDNYYTHRDARFFFKYEEGHLEYRSLQFKNEVLPVSDFQGVAGMNYTDEAVPYTRIVEHKHFDHFDPISDSTLITREYPKEWNRGETEFYPINTQANQERFKQYEERKAALDLPITFGGRLAEYRYYDMHQVIAAALKASVQLAEAFQASKKFSHV